MNQPQAVDYSRPIRCAVCRGSGRRERNIVTKGGQRYTTMRMCPCLLDHFHLLRTFTARMLTKPGAVGEAARNELAKVIVEFAKKPDSSDNRGDGGAEGDLRAN